ncbi:MAG TPA: hypothetical protein VGO80_00525 [Solirubrobacteraceae bacterium]|jgi:hypothetical protein|nr:hypothetical protein [Solirubrobacteraceae bacterium]
MRAVPGSFRDPDSRVFERDGDVFRALSTRGLDDWNALRASDAFAQLTERGSVIETQDVGDEHPATLRDGWAGVLRHASIPFVSYLYEWTFGMLRDAALLQLDVLERCLSDGLMVKDSSPYNVQWRGVSPVFIDIGSFERLREGEPWIAYRQFCMLFLYPLMFQAYKGIPFQPWMRGAIDGITPPQARAVMSTRDRLRRGVLTNVHLHSRFERRYAAVEGRTAQADVRRAGFGTELILANVRRLRKLVTHLSWEPGASAWSEYRDASDHLQADATDKAAFVATAAARRHRRLVWDLGANDGAYARLVADSSQYVIAMDVDHPTVERLYRTLRDEGERRILPLVIDVCDSSPGLGWRGRERGTVADRGRPDLTLCLALVHHMAITRNVPLREIVDWLASLGGTVVVEFPERTDPMVQRLLAGKRDGAHGDYERAHFERRLREAFVVERQLQLPSGQRTLYQARPLSA